MAKRGEMVVTTVLVVMLAALAVMIMIKTHDGGMGLPASVGLSLLPATFSAAIAHDLVKRIREHNKDE